MYCTRRATYTLTATDASETVSIILLLFYKVMSFPGAQEREKERTRSLTGMLLVCGVPLVLSPPSS